MAKRKPKPIQKQYFVIRKGLTREEALIVAKKRTSRDFRGMTYDPNTGELILV